MMFFIFGQMKQLTTLLSLSMALLTVLPGCNGKTEEKNIKSATANNKYTRASTEEMEAKGIQDLDNAADLKTILCQNWDNAEDVEDTKSANPDGNLEILFRGYSFFKDGTMVKDPRGDYKQGTWELHNAQKPYSIEMKYSGGSKDIFQVAQADPRSLTLNEVAPTTSGL